jgi:hypothetical protein
MVVGIKELGYFKQKYSIPKKKNQRIKESYFLQTVEYTVPSGFFH